MLRWCCGSVALVCSLKDQVYSACLNLVFENCFLSYFSLKCSSDTRMTSLYSPHTHQLDDDALQISRPYYSQPAISNYYAIRREELTRLAK